MRMKRNAFVLSLYGLIIMTWVGLSGVASINALQEDQSELSNILKKSAEYCEMLAHSVFHFVCLEEIEERIYYSPQRFSLYLTSARFFKKKRYVYDYQLIWKQDKIQERRTLVEENGQEKNETDAPLKTKRFKHKNMVFGPIGLLSEFWQPRHDYEILKEEKVNGEKAILIQAVPKSTEGQDHLYGRIWVKKSDSSILRIEWDQMSMGNFEEVQQIARRLRAEPRITLVAEYGYEKKGLRFPSKFMIKEEYIRRAPSRIKMSEIKISYRDYKFFVVETDVEYKKRG